VDGWDLAKLIGNFDPDELAGLAAGFGGLCED
jgi:hypothetical protein